MSGMLQSVRNTVSLQKARQISILLSLAAALRVLVRT